MTSCRGVALRPASKLVFIGRHLDAAPLREGLLRCLAGAPDPAARPAAAVSPVPALA